MQHFRMELHAVETLFDVFDCGMAAVFGACADAEALGKLRDLDTVAHPVDGGFVHVFKQRAFGYVAHIPYGGSPSFRPFGIFKAEKADSN